MHIVITGANRGIGLALTQYYIAQGHQVTAICRNSSEALNATTATVISGIDVSCVKTLDNLAQQFKKQTIDILINNAGILRSETLTDFNTKTIEEQFSVNALAPIKLTHALLSLLTQGSKIAVITSRMGSIADNGSGSYYGYRMSKAALNAGAKSLAIDLAPQGISVAILHPGFVQTDMVGHAGDISAQTAAERLAARIDGLNMENTGTFWHSNGEELPW
jgi:NAD(P)-dependent dehydrogenase (short-subunit alcohol dehydrogenase family)